MNRQPHSLDRTTVEREVRNAQAFWSRVAPVPDQLADEVITDIVEWSQRTRPLTRHETALVTLFKPKTAALFADRVWLQWPGEDPLLDFAFGWESLMSVRLAALHAFLVRTADESERASWETETSLTDQAEQFALSTERDLSQDYQARTGAAVAPLYGSTERREAQYQPGESPVIISVIENLDVVAEDCLTWEQVREFRRDKSARLAYRRFVHWLDKEMIDKSVEFIVDETSGRLEKYEWAMRKHGLQTVLGAIERTLDAKTLFGASAAAFTVQSLSEHALVSLLTGGGLLVGKAALSAAVKLIELTDIRRANDDVAFVHKAKKQLKA